MKEYIEREALIDKANNLLGGSFSAGLIYEAIEKAPTADVVEVVRCKDCKMATEDILLEGFYLCEKDLMLYGADHFCSYGERKEGADNA